MVCQCACFDAKLSVAASALTTLSTLLLLRAQLERSQTSNAGQLFVVVPLDLIDLHASIVSHMWTAFESGAKSRKFWTCST
jgi:hypothetical protein